MDSKIERGITIKKIDGRQSQNLVISHNLKLFSSSLKDLLCKMPSKKYKKNTNEFNAKEISKVSNSSTELNTILNMNYKLFYTEVFINQNYEIIAPKFRTIFEKVKPIKPHIEDILSKNKLTEIQKEYWRDILRIAEQEYISHFETAIARKPRKKANDC